MERKRAKSRKKERKQWRVREERVEGKDGPGPVMVSDTLCPAVHILGT